MSSAKILAASAAAAALVCALPAEAQQATKQPVMEGGVMVCRDVQYSSDGARPRLMSIAIPNPKPAKPVPAVIVIHGGGWNGGDRNSMFTWASMLAKNGLVGVAIDYRLAKEAPFPAQIQDCKLAVRFLRANAARYNINPKQIGVMGASAGGHLSSMLGLTAGNAEFEGDGGFKDESSQVQAVCDCFGPSDFDSWAETANKIGNDEGLRKLYGLDLDEKMRTWCVNFSLKNDGNIKLLLEEKQAERAKWASPLSYVEKCEKIPPFLIVHGDKDAWVPLQQSLLLADALDKKGADVNLKIMLNAGHTPDKAAKDIMDFFKRALIKQ